MPHRKVPLISKLLHHLAREQGRGGALLSSEGRALGPDRSHAGKQVVVIGGHGWRGNRKLRCRRNSLRRQRRRRRCRRQQRQWRRDNPWAKPPFVALDPAARFQHWSVVELAAARRDWNLSRGPQATDKDFPLGRLACMLER